MQEAYDEFWDVIEQYFPNTTWEIWDDVFWVVIQKTTLNPDGGVNWNSLDWLSALASNLPDTKIPDYKYRSVEVQNLSSSAVLPDPTW